MNNEAKIISLTPAVADWWAKFTDETEWFSVRAGDIWPGVLAFGKQADTLA